MTVAQELTNLSKSSTSAQQVRGKGVTQEVRTLELGIQARALERAKHNTTDGLAAF